ncbi:MAG: PAS domain-containing sensor histidine kinase [Flavipsychrobacter sp.]|nr:PAS domain-containing sensor histidine kinase [Flavipsychrobacter sp.]
MSELSHENEKRVESTHDNLMTFFNAMDDIFLSIDLIDMRLMQISRSCKEIFGYDPADFLANGQLWYQLIHPEDRHVIANDQAEIRKGKRVDSIYRIIHKDGTVRWVEKKLMPTCNEEGTVVRIDGIIRDITQRKAADEQHKAQEDWYKQIVETAQEGIWTIDENRRISFANKKMAEILGYTLDEMIGRDLFDFIYEDDKVYAAFHMGRRLDGVKEDLEIRYLKKNGIPIWTRIATNSFFDERGQYKGALAMVTDITERKLNEDALQKSEANLRTIYNNTDNAYILFDDRLNVISFNVLAQKYSEEQNKKPLFVNARLEDYFSPERMVEIQYVLSEVRTNGSYDYEIKTVKSDGASNWYHVRWVAVRNNENENTGFILINNNITASKLTELEREKITGDLIKRVIDLEQFNYIISHHLRAPVATIQGLLAMIKNKKTKLAEAEQAFEGIMQSTKDMDVVIHDLNDILQVRELIHEKKEVVNLNEIAREISTNLAQVLSAKNVQLNFIFEDDTALFTIRRFIYSIFYNLISNSIKFGKDEVSPVVHVTSYMVNERLRLVFSDNGKGIDLVRHRSKIFGLYQRFDITTQGKGIGLFIVKAQVEALGGKIELKSKLGEGTECIIDF